MAIQSSEQYKTENVDISLSEECQSSRIVIGCSPRALFLADLNHVVTQTVIRPLHVSSYILVELFAADVFTLKKYSRLWQKITWDVLS